MQQKEVFCSAQNQSTQLQLLSGLLLGSIHAAGKRDLMMPGAGRQKMALLFHKRQWMLYELWHFKIFYSSAEPQSRFLPPLISSVPPSLRTNFAEVSRKLTSSSLNSVNSNTQSSKHLIARPFKTRHGRFLAFHCWLRSLSEDVNVWLIDRSIGQSMDRPIGLLIDLLLMYGMFYLFRFRLSL